MTTEQKQTTGDQHILVTWWSEQDEQWNVWLQCPHPTEMLAHERADCGTWWECDCSISKDDEDELMAGERRRCPESPTGWHEQHIGTGDIVRPGIGCYAQSWGSGFVDAARDFAADHGAGFWWINLSSDGDNPYIGIGRSEPVTDIAVCATVAGELADMYSVGL